MALHRSVSWKDGAYFCFLSGAYSTGAAGEQRGRKDISLMLKTREDSAGRALRHGLGHTCNMAAAAVHSIPVASGAEAKARRQGSKRGVEGRACYMQSFKSRRQ